MIEELHGFAKKRAPTNGYAEMVAERIKAIGNPTPLHDLVLCQCVDGSGEHTLASGIVVPESAQVKNDRAIVLDVGPGRFEHGVLVPMPVKAGDRVLINPNGFEWQDSDKMKGRELRDGQLFLIRASEIYAVLT